MKLHIALLTAFYDERFKGNEYYLAKALSEKGHKVTIYVSRFSIPRYGKVIKLGAGTSLPNVTVVRLPSLGWKRKGLVWLFDLKKKLQQDKPDIVHVQEWFMPFVLSCVEEKGLVLTQRIDYYPLWLKVCVRLFGSRVLRKAKQVTALTTISKHLLINNTSIDNVTVIPNGVDTTLFKPKQVKKEKTFTILYAGRLSKEKGADVLLQACASLENYQLRIVGNGAEADHLKALADSLGVKASFSPAVSHEELPSIYSAADVVVMPSLKEPFGFVALEALACGTPVIGSAIGGLRDVITPKVGLLVPPNNRDALYEALTRMKKISKNLKKNCRTHVLNQYSWRKTAQRYNDIYNEVAS